MIKKDSTFNFPETMKFEIQTFTDSDDFLRFTFYESWFNNSIIVVKEKRFRDEDWSVVNSLAIPENLFGVLTATSSAPTMSSNISLVVSDDTNYRAKTIEDRLHLPLHVRKTLLDRDCEEIPLYENQNGYFNDVETLEWFWDIPKEDGKSHGSDADMNLVPPNTIPECDSCIFICETPSSAAALETPPSSINTDGEDVPMRESPSLKRKIHWII